MRRRIGIFAGTFDPVHKGHIAFCQVAMRACRLDEVVLIPEPKPRHKQAATPLRHRIAMLKQVVDDLDGLHVMAVSSEQFTVPETLPKLHQLLGDGELTLLLGSDVARHLSQWEQIDVMLGQMSLAIGLRRGDRAADIVSILRRLESESAVAPRVTFVQTEHAELASSHIRQGIVPSELNPVTDYMQRHGLYG